MTGRNARLIVSMSREVEDIKQRLDIVDVIQEYVPLKKAGKDHKGLCPFHQENSPSFMVSQEKQLWHCFGCAEGGDMFTFVQKSEGLDFYETLKLLAQKAGVTIEKVSPQETSKKTKLLDILELSTKFYHKVLLDHPKAQIARDYLAKRGIHAQSIKSFELGYAPENWDALLRFLQSRKSALSDMVDAGLIVNRFDGRQKTYDRFRQRLMIPIRNVHGQVIGFTGRTLDPTLPGGKYVNTPQTLVFDKSNVVFGLSNARNSIKERGSVIIVEGNIDVISSAQVGESNIVAISGTAFTLQQVKTLKRFAQQFLFAFDKDQAGLKTLRRSAVLCVTQGIDVNVITIPYGKDPDECIQKDPALWSKAIKDAIPVVDYLLQMAISTHDTMTPKGKKDAAAEVLPVVKAMTNPVEINSYVQKISNALQVSDRAILDALNQVVAEESDEQEEADTPKKVAPKVLSTLEQSSMALLSICLHAPAVFLEVELPEGIFIGSDVQDLYKKWKTFYSSGHHEGSKDAYQFFDKNNDPLINTLRLFWSKEFAELEPNDLYDAFTAQVNFLKKHYYQQELARVQRQLQEAERLQDQERIQLLTQEFSTLSQKMSQLS